MKRLRLLIIFAAGFLFCGCTRVPRYSLSVETYGGGYVPQVGIYREGSVVTLTPTPYDDYLFLGWDGPNASDVIDNKIIMNEDKALVALFKSVLKLTVDKNFGDAPLTISCHLDSEVADIVSCEWNFGDGIKEVGGMDVSHTYTNPGQYPILVLCKSESGKTYSAWSGVNVFTASLSLSTRAEDVHVSGSYAFVAAGEDGLRIADISIPSQPQWIGQYNTPAHSYGVTVRGNYAYLADGRGCFKVFDISNPSTPVFKGQDHYTTARSVCIAGDYAFVGDNWWKLHVISIADPTKEPTSIKSMNTSSEVISIVEHQNKLYVTEPFPYTTLIYDVSDPLNPHILSVIPGESYQVSVKGNYAYVAADCLRVIDVSDAANPVEIGRSNLYSNAQYIFIKDNYAYVSGPLSVDVYNIEEPTDPVWLGTIGSPRYITSVYVEAGYLFITSDYGLQYLPYDFWK